jgi:hypothetical protein
MTSPRDDEKPHVDQFTPWSLASVLHALGWSLWTGVVVALFVQVIPEVKRRQIEQAVDAYEALRRDEERARR